MSGRGKRLWAPRLSFDEAYREVLEFLQQCHKHNLTGGQGQPTLYHAFMVDGAWPVDGMIDASTVLRFGFDRSPASDQAKQAMARLLSVATKAHFFMAPKAIVLHEPFLFVIPDLGNPGQRRYGLVYPLENENRLVSIVVAEWDLSLSGSRQPRLTAGQKFPVVLPSDPFRWLSLKHWRALRSEAGELAWFETGPARGRLLGQVRSHQDPATFDLGHVLDYPKDMNEDLRAVGAMWAQGIRHWFLPKGWDVQAVREYLDALAGMDEAGRIALRWWTSRHPSASTRTKPGSARGTRGRGGSARGESPS